MYPKVISENDLSALSDAISNASNIAITCHMSPDGDAVGSSLALLHVLSSMGKHASIITPDQIPASLSFLPNVDKIIAYSCDSQIAQKTLSTSDLIFCLDFNSLTRVDKMAQVLHEAKATKVLIDHHLEPDDFTTIKISEPEISSTCLLLYYVLQQLGFDKHINQYAAECIYAGMMTDTGNFTYNSNDPNIFLAISELIKKGIRKDEIYRQVYNTNSESRLRVCGYALSNKMYLYPNHNAALIVLDKNDLKQWNYKKGDTEGLVNKPLSVPGICYSVYLREEAEYIKVSARSIGDFPVNKMCEDYFNGGGHKNAAGGEYLGTLKQAIELFESILNENDNYLKES